MLVVIGGKGTRLHESVLFDSMRREDCFCVVLELEVLGEIGIRMIRLAMLVSHRNEKV